MRAVPLLYFVHQRVEVKRSLVLAPVSQVVLVHVDMDIPILRSSEYISSTLHLKMPSLYIGTLSTLRVYGNGNSSNGNGEEPFSAPSHFTYSGVRSLRR
jgi:hypothetical protein